eukprot:CAMPEP_0197241344 /NCGR_PEP_ID=MMETSP1429-20130617/7405_1 /TAXON_ID=49237 /ORGANISM="Chaetoceros  sp., Strain UNC1202" /LENGTH=186 /DNA_ID=CAMNT_0042701165 /DNA_START=86 /DNA_END=643 /DNA_ORIENTATION=+
MWPSSQCTFIAADLPKFDEEDVKTPSSEINICAVGPQGEKENHKLAELFSKIPFKDYNAKFFIALRHDPSQLRIDIEAAGIGPQTSIVNERDYVKFHRNFAQCDIIVSLTDPMDRPNYFPGDLKKSSGILPALVAYKRPSVIHKEFSEIYQDHLTGPFEVYNNTMKSRVEALTRMLAKVHDAKKAK